MEIVKQKQQEVVNLRRARIIEFLRTKNILKEGNTNWFVTFDKNTEVERKEDIIGIIEELMTQNDNYPFMDLLSMVQQFHTVNNIPTEDRPIVPEVSAGAIRFNLMYEEAKETQDATRNEDLVECFDGLGDQMYILLGSILRYGMHNVFINGFMAIHDSNMTKLDPDGNPIYRKTDGKVMKGPMYKPPTQDLANILVDGLLS